MKLILFLVTIALTSWSHAAGSERPYHDGEQLLCDGHFATLISYHENGFGRIQYSKPYTRFARRNMSNEIVYKELSNCFRGLPPTATINNFRDVPIAVNDTVACGPYIGNVQGLYEGNQIKLYVSAAYKGGKQIIIQDKKILEIGTFGSFRDHNDCMKIHTIDETPKFSEWKAGDKVRCLDSTLPNFEALREATPFSMTLPTFKATIYNTFGTASPRAQLHIYSRQKNGESTEDIAADDMILKNMSSIDCNTVEDAYEEGASLTENMQIRR